MPKRKRRDKRPPVDGGPSIDPAVALFARRETEAKEAHRQAQRAAAAERKRAAEHERLVAAKDRAAARLKDLRSRDRRPAEAIAEADAAYKDALAALLEFETGTRPEWAGVADSAAPDDPDLGEQPADDADHG